MFFVAPEIVLTVWGLVVLLVDLGLARRASLEDRRYRVGMLSLVGIALAFVAAVIVCLVPLFVRGAAGRERWWISDEFAKYLHNTDPVIFFGTIAGDMQSSIFNVLFVALLGLVVGLSMSSSFTEELGEYFALLFWATVGMMLLDRRGGAGHAVLDARNDDDLPVSEHGPRKNPPALGGGGAQVFRLRLGVVGAIPVRAQPDLWHDRDDAA